MNPARLSTLVAQAALGAGQPLAPALEAASPSTASRRAAALATEGRLAEALAQLGFGPDLAWLGGQWPAALPLAAARRDLLPSPQNMRFEVGANLAGVGLTGLIIFAVGELLTLKVMGVFAHMAASFHLVLERWGPQLFSAAGWLGFLTGVALLAEARLGLVTGWKRHLERARQATFAQALSEAGAPLEVRVEHLGRCRALAELPPETEAVDLEAIAADAAARCEAAMARLAVASWVLPMFAAALAALGVSIDVFRYVGAFPGAM